MIAVHLKSRALLLLATTSVVLGFASASYAQLSGSYVAILNETNLNNPNDAATPGNNFSDSKRSVVFFDAQKLDEGPLFAVMVPFENGGSALWEEPQTVTVNPATGDIFLMAFDSTSPADQWTVDDHDTPEDESDDDTNGDLDMFRINFSTVLNHWKTNFMGQDVKTLGGELAVGNTSSVEFTMPMTTGDVTAAHAQDYVTYGVLSPFGEDAQLVANHNSPAPGVFDEDHPNTFQLGEMTVAGGAIEKIGEIDRNRYLLGSSNFFPQLVTFIDENTLFIIDDARQSRTNPHSAANDADFRMVERVSTSPGFATPPATPTGANGGFNNTTTESWESRRIAQMMLDTDQGTNVLSEAQSAAYHDAGSVRGVWVAERDQTTASCGGCITSFLDTGSDNGDDLAFLQLDGSNNSLGYREFVGGATKFQMSNDPGAGSPDGLGHIGKVFVDSDTGDLIVVEEGFMDSSPSEPAVIRASVNFNGGSGSQIALTWGSRVELTLGVDDKDPSDTTPERGYFSAYDSVTDTVYFAAPGPLETGEGDEAINNMLDIFVLDLNTGMTTAYLNVDDRFFPFFTTNMEARDSVVAFTLSEGLPGDYNGDGFVDAADYTVWRNNLGGDESALAAGSRDPSNMGVIDNDDYQFWKDNYGNGGPGSGGLAGDPSVPEPGSLALLLIGLAGWCCRRRA